MKTTEGNSRESKFKKILQAFKSGRMLTCDDMIHEFGVQRGGSVIHRIRCMGFDIDTNMVYKDNGDRYGEYRMLNPKFRFPDEPKKN